MYKTCKDSLTGCIIVLVMDKLTEFKVWTTGKAGEINYWCSNYVTQSRGDCPLHYKRGEEAWKPPKYCYVIYEQPFLLLFGLAFLLMWQKIASCSKDVLDWCMRWWIPSLSKTPISLATSWDQLSGNMAVFLAMSTKPFHY